MPKPEMTTHERMTAMYAHREADRVPIFDLVWESTIQRWRREGLPAGVNCMDYLGFDKIVAINFDTTPRFERKVIEETDSYVIDQDAFGLTKKNFKPCSSTPQHIDSIIKDPASWALAKPRMAPSSDRLDWAALDRDYKRWREEGAWITVGPWYGFDIVSTRMCGSELILYAMAENPEWVADMCNTGSDLALGMLDMIWDAGYHFDEFMWYDDMAYRNGLLFSPDLWREILRPYQKRAIDWAHAHGIKAHLHCCGRVTSLIPDLIELGLDALNPLEVKAGMDPAWVKKTYGDQLLLRGGFDIQNWSDPAKYENDIRTVLPAMMQSGGYVFASDHSIADSVALSDMRRIVALVKEIGAY